MNWKTNLAVILAAGDKPSYDDLEAALHGALAEREQFRLEVERRGHWLSAMAAAHLTGESIEVLNLLDEFIKTDVGRDFANAYRKQMPTLFAGSQHAH